MFKPFLAWLLRAQIIGQIPLQEPDVVEEANAAQEQRPDRDPGADRYG